MRINMDKRIGRVLFIVEGGRYEFSLLRKVFCGLLQYEYLERRRNSLDRFINGKDRYSTIAVINTKDSNIKDITDNADYLDEIFDYLREKYHFPIDQCAIYYLFDRDPRSNKDANRIREYILTLKNPYENDNGLRAGQLLLSYPSIESFTISNYIDNTSDIQLSLGKDAKDYISQYSDIQLNKLTTATLIHAVNEFLVYLSENGYMLDIDNFSENSLSIFEAQESEYLSGRGFRLFSMLALAFMQLGIIEFD